MVSLYRPARRRRRKAAGHGAKGTNRRRHLLFAGRHGLPIGLNLFEYNSPDQKDFFDPGNSKYVAEIV